MTRKENILTHAPIGQWVAKTNKMSDYIGDLDLLDSAFLAYDSSVGHRNDSNVVEAINFLWTAVDSVYRQLTQGVLRLGNLTADSGTFRIIRVGMMQADSATIDSAYIQNLTVAGKLDVESAEFDIINVDYIDVGQNGTLTIDSATVRTMNAQFLLADSARIAQATINNIMADSATIDSATINDTLVIGTGGIIQIDGVDLTDAKKLEIKNESGTVVLAGYMLSTSNTLGTP